MRSRTGGRGSPTLLVGVLVAALALAGTTVLWSRNHIAPAASVPAPPATRPPPDPATLQQLVARVVEAGAPGAVALVHTAQGTWQGASGLGDLRAKRPARAGDRFRITIRQLVAMATRHPPLFPPGTRFSYSNSNYILLGLVVERLTGDRLAAELHRRILAPRKLADTELPGTQRRLRDRQVHGYAPPDRTWLPSDGPAGLVDVTEADPSWAWAAGAMVSSAADLARFYQALLSGRLLGPNQLKAMQTTVDASEQFGTGAGYGLGLMRLGLSCGGQVWGHAGEIAGYATVAFSTQDAARQLVLMDNRLPAPGGTVQAAVEDALSQLLAPRPWATPRAGRPEATAVLIDNDRRRRSSWARSSASARWCRLEPPGVLLGGEVEDLGEVTWPVGVLGHGHAQALAATGRSRTVISNRPGAESARLSRQHTSVASGELAWKTRPLSRPPP